jgi:hypothetical protein
MVPGWLGRGFRLGLSAVWAAALLAGPGAAQQQGLTANDIYMQRQLRSLEGSVRSSPDSAALQLQRARRDMIQQSRGVAFTPEQARLNRSLDQVGRQLRQERTSVVGVPPRPATTEEPLPSSYGTDQPLPSFNRSATLGRLVGRAETAIAEGRPAQARSDLATARSLMMGVEPTDPDGGTELTSIQARMTALEARLGSSGS